MLELRNRLEERWDADLLRLGDDSFHPEVFETWWERVEDRLGHLDPQIAEQWVYRHFRYTRFRFLPLQDLTWRRETWSTEEYLRQVHLEWGGPAEPIHDYQAFNGAAAIAVHPTVNGWTQGTWDFPPVVLATPYGVRSYDGEMPDVRFLVVEGSKRYRYLNALHHRGEQTGPHELFLLQSPVV